MSWFGGQLRSLLRRFMPDAVAWCDEIEATRKAIGAFNDALAERAAARKVSTALIRALQVAMDELLTNVLMHGSLEEGRPIRVVFDCERDWVQARISYHAPEFDPTGRNGPDITQGVEKRDIGGLGLLLVTQLMDRFEHSYHDKQNHLLVHKREKAANTSSTS